MKNYRLIILSVLAVALAACGGAEERKAVYMERAAQSLESGNLEKARIELKNVLQIDPKSHEAYFMLGKMFEEQANYKRAYISFNKALNIAPENPEYLAKTGSYLLILGNDVEAAEEKLSTIKQASPDDINGLLLEANIAIFRKQNAKALEITDRIRAIDPSHVSNAMLTASIMKEEGKPEESLKILQQAASYHDFNRSLVSRMAGYLLQLERYDEAEGALKKILADDEDNYNAYINLARFYIGRDDLENAENILLESIANDPDDSRRRLELITMIESQKDVESAIAAAREQIDSTDDDGDIRLKLAQLQLKAGDQPAAIKTLRDIIELYRDDANSIRARLALTNILISSGDRDAAREMLDEALAISPNDADANMLNAQMSLVDKDIEQGIISLRRVIKDDPEKLGAYLLLAQAHKINGEDEQARNVLAQALENNRGNLPVLLQLARNHMNAKRFEDAERVIDDYLRIDDKNYDALSIKALTQNIAGRRDEAAKYAEKLRELFPDKINGYIQALPAMMEQERLDDAIALLETGMEKAGDDMQLLSLYTRLVLSQGDIDKATDRVRQSIAADSDIKKYLLLTKIYSDNKRMEDASKAIDEGLSKHPENEDAYIIRLRLHSMMGETDKAESVLMTGREKASTDNKLSQTLATLYERRGEIDKAIAVYQEMIEAAPENVVAINNKAALLVDGTPSREQVDEALSLVEQIENVKQDAIQDTVAWVYYHAGRLKDAKRIMEPIVSRTSDVQEYYFHYGMILHKLGDNEGASEYLQKAIEGDSNYRGKDLAKSTYDQIS